MEQYGNLDVFGTLASPKIIVGYTQQISGSGSVPIISGGTYQLPYPIGPLGTGPVVIKVNGQNVLGWGQTGIGSGYSGFSGYSGLNGAFAGSGYSGFSGYSGLSGFSGFSGKSGFSGFSGVGTSGFSGFSGIQGIIGTSGYSGFSGISGYSGFSGLSGYSGFSGVGTAGNSGYSGFSGIQGFSGTSGYSGAAGLASIGPGVANEVTYWSTTATISGSPYFTITQGTSGNAFWSMPLGKSAIPTCQISGVTPVNQITGGVTVGTNITIPAGPGTITQGVVQVTAVVGNVVTSMIVISGGLYTDPLQTYFYVGSGCAFYLTYSAFVFSGSLVIGDGLNPTTNTAIGGGNIFTGNIHATGSSTISGGITIYNGTISSTSSGTNAPSFTSLTGNAQLSLNGGFNSINGIVFTSNGAGTGELNNQQPISSLLSSSIYAFYFFDAQGNWNPFTYTSGTSSHGYVTFPGTASASNLGSGSVIISGGVSIGGNTYIGGNAFASTLVLSSTTITTSPSNGALIVAGGAGIGGSVKISGTLGIGALNPSTSGNNLTWNAQGVVVDSGTRSLAKYTAYIGDGSSTLITVNHLLNTEDVNITVWDTFTGSDIPPSVYSNNRVDINNITITFGSPPSYQQYRIIVIG